MYLYSFDGSIIHRPTTKCNNIHEKVLKRGKYTYKYRKSTDFIQISALIHFRLFDRGLANASRRHLFLRLTILDYCLIQICQQSGDVATRSWKAGSK